MDQLPFKKKLFLINAFRSTLDLNFGPNLHTMVFTGKNLSIEHRSPLPYSGSIDAKFNGFIEICHLPLAYDVNSVVKKIWSQVHASVNKLLANIII